MPKTKQLRADHQQHQHHAPPLPGAYLLEVETRIRHGVAELYNQAGLESARLPTVIHLATRDAPRLLGEVKRLRALLATYEEAH